MLDEMNPTLTMADTSKSLSEAVMEMPEEGLQSAIKQFAQRLRHTGHVESAHFLDVAALVLKEQQRC